jgi:hypothetical protein
MAFIVEQGDRTSESGFVLEPSEDISVNHTQILNLVQHLDVLSCSDWDIDFEKACIVLEGYGVKSGLPGRPVSLPMTASFIFCRRPSQSTGEWAGAFGGY